MLLALGIKGFDSLLTEDNTTTVAPSTASSIISESVNTDGNELGELNLQSTSFGATGDLRNSSILVSENMEVMSDTTIVGFVPSNVDIASTTLDPATTTIDIIDIRNNTMFDVEDGTVETMYDLEEDFMTTMSTFMDFEAFSMQDTTPNVDSIITKMDQESITNTVSSNIFTMNTTTDNIAAATVPFTYSTASDLQTTQFGTNMMLITSQPNSSLKNFFDESNMSVIILTISLTTLFLLTSVLVGYLLYKKKSKLICCDEYCYFKCWYQICSCCNKPPPNLCECCLAFCSTNSKISSFHEDTRSNSTRWAVSCLSRNDESFSSSEEETDIQEKRPKTAFQRLNSRFEKVLTELKQVHLRTMKPAGLPPMNDDKSTTPVIDIGINSRPKSQWKNHYNFQGDFKDDDLPDVILI